MFHSSLVLSTTKAVNRKEAAGYSKKKEKKDEKFLASLCS